MELFFDFENIGKLNILWSKNQNPIFEFRRFGHNSTSNNSVGPCCIFLKLKVFLMHIFRRIRQSHQAFLISFSFSVRYCFFAQKEVSHFRNSKQRLTRYNHLSLGFQKGKNIWNRFTRSIRKGGGGTQGLHWIASLHVHMYSPIIACLSPQKKVFVLFHCVDLCTEYRVLFFGENLVLKEKLYVFSNAISENCHLDSFLFTTKTTKLIIAWFTSTRGMPSDDDVVFNHWNI